MAQKKITAQYNSKVTLLPATGLAGSRVTFGFLFGFFVVLDNTKRM